MTGARAIGLAGTGPRRGAVIGAGLALAASLAIHLWGLVAVVPAPRHQPAGDGATVAIAAAPEAWSGLARQWASPPRVAEAPPAPAAPATSDQPDGPGASSPPDMVQTAPPSPPPVAAAADTPALPAAPPALDRPADRTAPLAPPAPEAEAASSAAPVAEASTVPSLPPAPRAPMPAEGTEAGQAAPSAPAAPAPAASAPTPAATAAQSGARTSEWESGVRRSIVAALRRPAGIGRDGGRATVGFGIGADGALGSAEIVQSSGVAAIDRAVLAALERAAPFEPPPGGAATRLRLSISFAD